MTCLCLQVSRIITGQFGRTTRAVAVDKKKVSNASLARGIKSVRSVHAMVLRVSAVWCPRCDLYIALHVNTPVLTFVASARAFVCWSWNELTQTKKSAAGWGCWGSFIECIIHARNMLQRERWRCETCEFCKVRVVWWVRTIRVWKTQVYRQCGYGWQVWKVRVRNMRVH